MATYVLISGAWHASWCWERVIPLLEARGHRVIAPDLLGMGDDPTPLDQVDMTRWVDQVVAIVAAAPEPVILVGHSLGGVVISQTAERVPERIARLVYVTAVLVPDGTSVADLMAPPDSRLTHDVMILDASGALTVKEDEIGRIFYNCTPEEWVARAKSKLTPTPVSVMSARLSLTDARFGSVPRAYIECTLDYTGPISAQRAMYAALPCDPVITLETDHSPFYSCPGQFADALIDLA